MAGRCMSPAYWHFCGNPPPSWRSGFGGPRGTSAVIPPLFWTPPRAWLAWRIAESPISRLRTKRMVTEEYLVRHVFGIQQSLGNGDPDSVYSLPGLDKPADGVTSVKSDMTSLLRHLESGACRPSILRPLRGVSSNEEHRDT